ncbi:MAG: carbohydrate binding domain-containing protein [bacterium]
MKNCKNNAINLFLLSTVLCYLTNCDPPIPQANDPAAPTIDKTEIVTKIDTVNDSFIAGESVKIKVTARDLNEDPLIYCYKIENGDYHPPINESIVSFIAPALTGKSKITVLVQDNQNGSDTAYIDINVINSINLGIFSETDNYKLLLDKNSFLGLYSGGGAVVNEFVDDPNEKREGNISKKMTINVASTNQWAGWFVMYGTETTPDIWTRDVTLFKGGTLKFWIKSEISDLLIGLRSGDVTAGDEYKMHLKNIFGFQTGQWVEISIPIVNFTDPSGGNEKADLSQLKVFFTIASAQESGGTNGTKSFWIDQVRFVRSGQQ